jgi:hypothetical protein
MLATLPIACRPQLPEEFVALLPAFKLYRSGLSRDHYDGYEPLMSAGFTHQFSDVEIDQGEDGNVL